MPRLRETNEQMRAQSKQQIVDAARRLFASQGYFNVKVSEIAGVAGMSQGNVYWYFPSKEDLLKAVLADGFAAVEEAMREATDYPGPTAAKLRHLVDRYIAFCHEKGDFTAVFLSVLGHGGMPLLWQLGFDTLEIGRRYHARLSPLLAQARVEGMVADEAPDQLAVYFFSLFNGLMITYGNDWQMIDRESLAKAALRLLGAG